MTDKPPPILTEIVDPAPSREHIEHLAALVTVGLAPQMLSALVQRSEVEQLARMSVGLARAIVSINRDTD